jgi:diaminopimelate dehydrogenase
MFFYNLGGINNMKIGIIGYGNLGRGVEIAVNAAPDMELAAVFTRRDPSSLKIQTAGVPVVSVNDVASYKDKIDVMILCGGSATDLPVQTPEYAKMFNVVDSFDTHARIPEHFANVDAAAKKNGNIAVISCGWDPGMFSIARVYGSAILPDANDYTLG